MNMIAPSGAQYDWISTAVALFPHIIHNTDLDTNTNGNMLLESVYISFIESFINQHNGSLTP